MLRAKNLSYQSLRLLTQPLQQQQGAKPPSSSRLRTEAATALLTLLHGVRAAAAGLAAWQSTPVIAEDIRLECLRDAVLGEAAL
jgi:hypothetical protein